MVKKGSVVYILVPADSSYYFKWAASSAMCSLPASVGPVILRACALNIPTYFRQQRRQQ
jgi:hypothetical protein